MLDFVVYLLYRAGSAVTVRLPLRFLFALGQLLGLGAWLVSRKYRRLAARNLAIAFANEKSPSELRGLVRQHFQRLGANLLCSIKLMQMPPETILQRVEVENIQALELEFRAGFPVVLVLSHLRTCDVVPQLIPTFDSSVRNAPQ